MTRRPPSPQTTSRPIVVTSLTDSSLNDRAVMTTPQLAARLEAAFSYRLPEATIERLLIELDRRGFVEWGGVTRSGEYVWDLSESPERIANAVADAIADWLERRLE